MTLLAGLQVLLWQIYGAEGHRGGDAESRTGSGRRVEGLIGFFVNTLVLRTEVEGRAEVWGAAGAGEGGGAGSV